MNQFPPSLRVFQLDRFEFFRKFAEIFTSQGAPRYQRHRWQIFPPFSLALLIPVANLPPVSMIPAANLPPVSTTPAENCYRYQRRHRWQIMATISGCRQLKVNLNAKIYMYVNSTTQRCPNKIIKIFLLEGFSICHRCRWHRWQTLSCEYLCEFSKKFETALMI